MFATTKFNARTSSFVRKSRAFFMPETLLYSAFAPCNGCNGFCKSIGMTLTTGSERRFFVHMSKIFQKRPN